MGTRRLGSFQRPLAKSSPRIWLHPIQIIKPHPWTDEIYLNLTLCAHQLQKPTHTGRKPKRLSMTLNDCRRANMHECMNADHVGMHKGSQNIKRRNSIISDMMSTFIKATPTRTELQLICGNFASLVATNCKTNRTGPDKEQA